MARFGWWRAYLILTAVFLAAGGPLHPVGSMAAMLGHPDWVMSHLLMLAGFVAMAIGLVAYGREVDLPARSARWTRWATWATVFQAVEMAVHTAAVVDHHNLVAGRSTPVLVTHLTLSVMAYPVFGLATAGWIVATARDRAISSPWLAPLGVVGALAHGTAPVLVVAFGILEARFLFPMLLLLALWLATAAVWPLRGELRQRRATASAAT